MNSQNKTHCNKKILKWLLQTAVLPKRIFVASLFFLLFSYHLNGTALIINDKTQHIDISPELELLYDKQETLSIDDTVDKAQTMLWTSAEKMKEPWLMPAGVYWFRVQLDNPLNREHTIAIQVEYPSINLADMYSIDVNGKMTTIYRGAGLLSRFDNRPLPHRNLVNRLTLQPHSSITLLWRIDIRPTFEFKVSAWSTSHFFQQDQQQQVLYGMVYGILLVMALYNFFLFLSTKEKSYLFYVFYVLTANYLLAAQEGHIYQYFATDVIWAKPEIFGMVYALNLTAFGLFCSSFLNLKTHSKKLFSIIRVSSISSSIFIVLVTVIGGQVLISFSFASSMVLFGTALIAGISVRKAGVISAGHFVIAMLVLSFALVGSNMATLGLIESNGITESLPAVGTTLMLIFFSLALADRINQLQKENHEAGEAIANAIKDKSKARNELHKLQQKRIELEQSSSEARLESRSKSMFLATMSHEIREPLREILDNTNLMKSTILDKKQTQYLGGIEHSGDVLLTIVDDLQDFAKIEAGEMELEYASFNLETLLDDCISTFALRAVEKNINFIADLNPEIQPVLKGDASKLRQIILNLLSNAFKFTKQGEIVVRVNRTSKSAVNFTELKFEVFDSGIGMTQDEQKRLFSPFLHVDDSTYGQYGGSGLGLSISKQLADLMDGAIGVVSEFGKGSCFWFTARLLADDSPDKQLLRVKSPLLLGKNVLLIDPSIPGSAIISRTLITWGMKVETAISVIQAKDIIASSTPLFDIILCEYDLADNDALAFAKDIHTDTSTQPVFVLMATSHHLDRESEIRDYGIDILLEKPITHALLHDVLKRALSENHNHAKSTEVNDIDRDKPRLKVLIVEDNQINQTVVKSMLKKFDIVPFVVSNGLEALDRYENHEFDLILMDCEMPEMNGYEATKQIRTREKQNGRKRTEIIALSAHARSDYQHLAEQAGMDTYLSKPVTLSDLETIIAKLIQT
ncbi:MAG: signal transduction histidine kinase/CheY-like chemotaxis protein [Oceanicoccus sp.]|jgi:signal transduction histidine kinase/CheY-like chemotaxis protein